MPALAATESSPLLQRLRKGAVLGDGAMGTMLYSLGVSYESCMDELVLSNPQLVLSVHQRYIQAGSEVIQTNTFGANRPALARYGLENQVNRINRQAVKVAREAREIAGQDVLIAGTIGPMAVTLQPFGPLSADQAAGYFKEQAEGLLEGGADLLVLDTFTTLQELELALRGVFAACDLPVVAQLSYEQDGAIGSGEHPEQVAARLKGSGIAVLGANCSVGPQAMLDCVVALKGAWDGPVSAQPNAGLPVLVSGRHAYLATPPYMAEYARLFAKAGVALIGGCCGTTPEHIAAMRAALEAPPVDKAEAPPTPRPIAVSSPELKTDEERESPDPFRASLGKKFMVSVEIDPPKGAGIAKALRGAKLLKDAGVDAVNIADSPMARVRMSCTALAALIEREVGVHTIIHYTTRDRSLMGIQSDLLGAHALGIRTVLAITGDPPSRGDHPNSSAVYDVDAIGLVAIIAALNGGHDYAGNSIGRGTNFTIGVALNPVAEDVEREIDRFRQKVENGAQFAFTQPLYQLSDVERILPRVEGFGIPIFLGILPLQSHRHAEFLHNEVPGMVIPNFARKRMRDADENGVEAGVEMAQDLLSQAAGLVQGAYLMPSFGRYEVAARVLQVLD